MRAASQRMSTQRMSANRMSERANALFAVGTVAIAVAVIVAFMELLIA